MLENAIIGEQLLEVIAHFEERIAERLDIGDQLLRQVLMHAADPKIVRVHAAAGGALVEPHELFTLFKAPQRRCECADIHGLRGYVEQMRKEPPDLAIEHADELGAARDGDAEELFRRQAEGVLLVHRRHVIEAVEIRDRLQVSFVLDQLLGAPVQETDMRIDTLHDLAVQLEHEAQHAVRGRMLRAEIDSEIT